MYALYFSTPVGWTALATIDGCEAAYAVYHKACELAELLGTDVALGDDSTGEIVACLSDDADE